MKNIIMTSALLVATMVVAGWFTVTTSVTGIPGWGWARPATGVTLGFASIAAILSLGSVIIRATAGDDTARLCIAIDLNEYADFVGMLGAIPGIPAIIWWGLYLA